MKVVLSGYYGFDNAGDEAILAAMVEMFRAGGDLEPIVLSGNPTRTEALHGVSAVNRYCLRSIRRALQRAAALVSGGGGLLQDATSVRSNLYYLGVIWLARRLRRKVMVYAQSIGPLRRRITRWLVRWGLRGVDLLTVRDEPSRELLTALGWQREEVLLTADPTFALTPAPPERAEEILRAAGVPENEPRVGVVLRPTPRAAQVSRVVVAALNEFLAKHPLRVVFLPFHPPGDCRVAEACSRQLHSSPAYLLPGGYRPQEWMALCGRCQLLLSERLHGLIFAATQGVPLVGIAYDPKVTGLLEQLDEPPPLTEETVTRESLVRALEAAWQEREERSARLHAAATRLRERAWKNTRLLHCLLAPSD